MHADAEDLRQIMKNALHATDDATMIEILEVGRGEWPDAVKTLQRKLEEETEKSSKSPQEADQLHREFIESGIDSLRRISGGSDRSLPSWTITKYEVSPFYGRFSSDSFLI